MIRLCKANFPLYLGIDTKETTGLWLVSFQKTADDVFETAIRLCMLKCKSFPTVADIKSAIDELRHEVKTQQQPPMIARSRRVDPNIMRALDLAKQGKTKELLAGFDVSDLLSFAKTKFPDISESTVRRNFNEILAAKESGEQCFACRYQPNQCLTNGFYVDMKLQPNGWIKNEYVRCPKHAQQQKVS